MPGGKKKMDIDPTLAANAKIALGAGAGGIVRMALRPARSLSQTALLLFSCITCGFYGARPFIGWAALPVDYAGAVGALFGFIGLSFAEAALKFDFAALLVRWLGGRV